MINALTFCRDHDSAAARRAHRALERQGFVVAASAAWPDGVLVGWSRSDRTRAPSDEARAEPSEGFVQSVIGDAGIGTACCVGPLWYRGRFGNDALHLLLKELGSGQEPDEAELRGNFVAFLRVGDHAWLFNDPLGFARVYRAGDGRFFGTSWLAVRAYTGDGAVDAAAATEYVLLGASHSDATVAAGVRKLPLGYRFDLVADRMVRRPVSGLAWIEAVPRRFEDAVDRVAEHLATVFRDAVLAFPDNIRAALSGGFDSRLILAGLLAQGAQPDLFVYGTAGSSDVVVARTIADGMNLSLRVVDKGACDRQLPEPDEAALVASAFYFDGLPNDGILDRGADRKTRQAQAAAGALVLNGGGGEIFRNFFHLPDRTYGARDLVHVFYRAFDAAVLRSARDLGRYEERLEASIARSLAAVDVTPGPAGYGRDAVELVYPLFRCHHWMGVNNSVALREGWFATPLLDATTVGVAHRLPLTWKDAGRLESRLITRLNPPVATYDSGYGFRFSDGPGARQKASERLTQLRPAGLRPLVNAIARRMRREGIAPVQVAKLRARLPGEWQVDAFLDVARLPDASALARAVSIEIVSRFVAP